MNQKVKFKYVQILVSIPTDGYKVRPDANSVGFTVYLSNFWSYFYTPKILTDNSIQSNLHIYNTSSSENYSFHMFFF